MPRRVGALLIVASLAGVTSCSSTSSNNPIAAITTVASDSATSTTLVADSTTTTTTTSTTTTTTTTTTLPASTTTTSTVPRSVEQLVLRGDGIGAAMFGGDPDSVIEYVRSLLGEPTGDTGWVDPFTFALCEGNEVRRVDWGVLSLLFGDQSNFGSGRRHFFAWEYGLTGQIGDPPQGLRTAGLVTLGSRVVDLRAEFPEVAINEAEDDGFASPPNYYVSDNFRGLLTGATDDDVITVMFGGLGCGA